MGCFGRSIFRWGLVGGLVVGGLALVSPGFRHAAGTTVAQVRHKATDIINSCVDDPVALRHQLATLADEYPQRIQEVKSELAKVSTQLGELHRDTEIAQRVVTMTTDDLSDLKRLVQRAETEMESGVRSVAIRYEGVRYNLGEAYAEAERINNVRSTYQDRLAADEHQVKFLNEQKQRLNEILVQLETEYEQYQAQLWQLDHQIDAIERNERLIEMTNRQQETLDGYNRFGKVGNLKQIQSKLAELRTIQESQLQRLSKMRSQSDYERKARYELGVGGVESDGNNPFADLPAEDDADTADVASDDDDEADRSKKAVAFSGPVIID